MSTFFQMIQHTYFTSRRPTTHQCLLNPMKLDTPARTAKIDANLIILAPLIRPE